MSESHRPVQQTIVSGSLVNYRSGIGGDDAQLTLYSVESPGNRIALRAPHLMYYGVVEGESVVQGDGESFSLSLGESLIVPPLQEIVLEFPDGKQTPAKYVALRIDRNTVRSLLDQIPDDPLDVAASREWSGRDEVYCRVEKKEGVRRVLEMIAYLFREDPSNRDALIDLNAMELIVQMLQTPSRALLLGEFPRNTPSGGLAAAVQYIHDNLDRHISVDELVEKACMSKSSFYRHFSDEFDMAPLEYITKERIARARELLAEPDNTVTNVSHALGFSSTSHFIDMFKEYEGVTPKQYQMDLTD